MDESDLFRIWKYFGFEIMIIISCYIRCFEEYRKMATVGFLPKIPPHKALPDYSHELILTEELFFEKENKTPAPSKTDNFDMLIQEKSTLEKESLRLEIEQKELNQRARVLSERLIREKKRRNDEKQHEISQLQTRISTLENLLQQLSFSEAPEKYEVGKIPEILSKLESSVSHWVLLDPDCDGFTVEILEEINPDCSYASPN